MTGVTGEVMLNNIVVITNKITVSGMKSIKTVYSVITNRYTKCGLYKKGNRWK